MFEELRNACRGGAAIDLNAAPNSSAHIKYCLCHWSRSGWFSSRYETNRECRGTARNCSCLYHFTKSKNQIWKKTDVILSILPQKSIGLPDVHSGYGFAIGNMAAFDMNDPAAVVSPGTLLPFNDIWRQKSIFEELRLFCRWCWLWHQLWRPTVEDKPWRRRCPASEGAVGPVAVWSHPSGSRIQRSHPYGGQVRGPACLWLSMPCIAPLATLDGGGTMVRLG